MSAVRAAHLVDRLLASGVFVGCCAAALSWETTRLAGRAAAPPRAWTFHAFVFVATWAAYRLHAIARPARSAPWSITDLLPFIATAALAVTLPLRDWPILALAALLSAAYSLPALPRGRSLRQYGLVKIAVLAGVWTLVTAYLPVRETTDSATLLYLCARRFAFMFALCVAFDVRDLRNDARSGIRTIAVRLGEGGSYTLMRATLLAFAVLVLVGPFLAHPAGGWATLALLASALITWAAIEATRWYPTHRFYLGCIDGMMLVQGALVVLLVR